MQYHRISHTQIARTVYRSVEVDKSLVQTETLSVDLSFRHSVSYTIDRTKGIYRNSFSRAFFFLSCYEKTGKRIRVTKNMTLMEQFVRW